MYKQIGLRLSPTFTDLFNFRDIFRPKIISFLFMDLSYAHCTSCLYYFRYEILVFTKFICYHNVFHEIYKCFLVFKFPAAEYELPQD